ncbi:hypothetical protein BpHYR1_034149 [Brachionus plicatilis]|uniref:Uncharacterized protein n=1 Tax=Brachionus plicatilis TaxID=10195 RepID=A0A3M7S6S9_BRAPC|nr:hypothetical protein BpHYR1_034149 [Brachionus plicatilis]
MILWYQVPKQVSVRINVDTCIQNKIKKANPSLTQKQLIIKIMRPSKNSDIDLISNLIRNVFLSVRIIPNYRGSTKNNVLEIKSAAKTILVIYFTLTT